MNSATFFSTARLDMHFATESDIEYIIALEHHPQNRNFIWQGTRKQHLDEISDPDHILMIFREKSSGDAVGYALAHIGRASNIFELRRIAIDKKRCGYGKEILLGLFEYAFTELGTNRFWLDVYPDNTAGIALYEQVGMVKEGILRENYKSERGYLDQIVYSLLRREYFNKQG